MPETVRMDPAGVVEDKATAPLSRSVDVDGPTVDAPTREIARADKPSEERPRARRCPECRQIFSGEARFCPFDGDALVDAPDWNPTADPFIGQTVEGRYLVNRVIGEGGMGTIYEVSHTTLGRKFALKVLRRDLADEELNARFIQEAKAAASIGHPNIVAVNDFGTIEVKGKSSVPYFVMEHLEGETLADVLRRDTSIAPRRAAGLVVQCVSGLAAAHAAGVIHRDLKPDNIFLTRVARSPEGSLSDPRGEFVKLLDFGVAKMVGAGRLTLAGTVFGTPHYMSPEQAAGHAVDPRADIYALGIILYECLSGRVPFEADSYMGVLTKHMFATPEPIEKTVGDPRALGGLGPIVMRCLAKEPGERYATMEEVGAALELFLRDPSTSAASTLGPRERSIPDFSLRDAVSMEGRVNLPQPPITRIWPKILGAGLAVIGLLAVVRFVAMPSKAPSEASPSAAKAVTQPARVAPPPLASAAPSAASSALAAAPRETAAAEPETSGPAPKRGGRRPPTKRPAAAGHLEAPPRDVVDPWAK